MTPEQYADLYHAVQVNYILLRIILSAVTFTGIFVLATAFIRKS